MSVIFEGNLRVYLQGNNALKALSLRNHEFLSAIGSENSEIIIQDYRQEPIEFAKTVNAGGKPDGFGKIFNQPARAIIRYDQDTEGLEISLHESSIDTQYPILWMGVLDDNTISGHQVEWEVFKKLPDERTAFAALIP